ncbi:MAG: hypothetical protein PHU03_03310 [Syntrophales bacterium]|nr:hypothetical protein [Syntrophales bacterium]
MRKILSISIVLIMAFLTAGILQAGQGGPPVPFSADYVVTGEMLQRGKYFGAPEGIRMEIASDEQSSVMIFSFPQRKMWHVMEGERMYLETSFDPEEDVVGGDAMGGPVLGGPCAGYDGKDTKLGREKLQGRNVIKWSCEDLREGVAAVWFDERLQMPIRIESDESSFEFQGIKEGPLSGYLFKPPAGYMKLEMPSPFGAGSLSGAAERAPEGTQASRSEESVQPSQPETEEEGGTAEMIKKGVREGIRNVFGR